MSSKYSGCPKYVEYSQESHGPFTHGELKLSSMRPDTRCRTFRSEVIEQYIGDMTAKIADPDLSRLFENTFPNTLDTTIKWHDKDIPKTFIITGDIDAMWIRDSTFSLDPYHEFSKEDPALLKLIAGTIETQASFLAIAPHCNAFQPPAEARIAANYSSFYDAVTPHYDPDRVFECKYEIDSLASFFYLSRRHFQATNDTSIFTHTWVKAVQAVFGVIQAEMASSFDPETGVYRDPPYTFRRQTEVATETLALNGAGYPVASGTNLVRSAFRPSDDSTVFQFFIPGNAFLSVELEGLAVIIRAAEDAGISGAAKWAERSQDLGQRIRAGILEHGVVQHPAFGKVLAYEVDGYGSALFMDDANMPSLLGLPLIGFLEKTDPIYVATRRMVLSSQGNPWYMKGKKLAGGGSPHTPPRNVWPMSLLVQILTSDDPQEVELLLQMVVQTTSKLGLMHESVNAWNDSIYTRPWFAWANAVFGQAIIHISRHFPSILRDFKAQT